MGEAELVLGSFGYFLIVGTLLGLSGLSGSVISIPSSSNAEDGGTTQSFTGAVIECIFTFFSDCTSKTTTKTFSTITNVLAFASSYLFFFLQLLTFQLPIPGWLNAIIVLPPAVTMLYVGIRFIRGGG